MFVILTMDTDGMRNRVKERHHGDDSAVELMAPINKMCDPIGLYEENVVSLSVTFEMTKEDVVNKILELVK